MISSDITRVSEIFDHSLPEPLDFGRNVRYGPVEYFHAPFLNLEGLARRPVVVAGHGGRPQRNGDALVPRFTVPRPVLHPFLPRVKCFTQGETHKNASMQEAEFNDLRLGDYN